MKLITPFLAGAAVLALGSVALADEAKLGVDQQPIQLTDTQMDGVTAGFANAGGGFFAQCISATCSASGSGFTSASVFDNNVNASANASSSLNLNVFSGTVQNSTNAFANAGV